MLNTQIYSGETGATFTFHFEDGSEQRVEGLHQFISHVRPTPLTCEPFHQLPSIIGSLPGSLAPHRMPILTVVLLGGTFIGSMRVLW